MLIKWRVVVFLYNECLHFLERSNKSASLTPFVLSINVESRGEEGEVGHLKLCFFLFT